MSEPKNCRTSWLSITTALLFPCLFCLPLAAKTPGQVPDHAIEIWSKSSQTATITSFRANASAPAGGRTRNSMLREQLNDAKAIFKDLKSFTDTAKRTISLSQELKKTRLDNGNLKRAIAEHTLKKIGKEQNLGQLQDKVSGLTETIVANWLSYERLNDQIAAEDTRLTLTRTAWLEANHRLMSLKKRLKDLRNHARDLRGRSAALAAEIGRTRRQAVNLKLQRRLASIDQQAIALTIGQLRHDVSASLRTLLSVD